MSRISLKDLMESPAFKKSRFKLPIVYGRETDGNDLIADLAEAPNVFIGGNAGQGKTMAMKNIIASLLLTKTPEELKLMLIDPKKNAFKEFKHLGKDSEINGTSCVFQDMQDIEKQLDYLQMLLDARYNVLHKARRSNIVTYNKKEEAKMPYVVIVIDEFADIVNTIGKRFEQTISQLAQKGRVVGIHIIMATQSTDRKMVWPLIEQCFYSRLAFRTSTMIESRTICGCTEAYYLKAPGTALYTDDFSVHRKEIAIPFISEQDIIEIIASRSQ